MGSAPSSKHFHECGTQLSKRRLSEQYGGMICLLKPGSKGGREREKQMSGKEPVSPHPEGRMESRGHSSQPKARGCGKKG